MGAARNQAQLHLAAQAAVAQKLQTLRLPHRNFLRQKHIPLLNLFQAAMELLPIPPTELLARKAIILRLPSLELVGREHLRRLVEAQEPLVLLETILAAAAAQG